MKRERCFETKHGGRERWGRGLFARFDLLRIETSSGKLEKWETVNNYRIVENSEKFITLWLLTRILCLMLVLIFV